jgi:cytochrome c553
LHSGGAIYEGACAACHGPHGEGAAQAVAGFEKPDTFPHFNKCDETAAEYTRDWKAVIRDGGEARGFSQIMPAFGGVLTDEQMDAVVAYLRSLCEDKTWPVGELNVPRALVTEKAFPESETVLTSAIHAKGASGASNELVYERILDKRDQLEVALPFGWMDQNSGAVTGGVGDLAVGLKHVIFSGLTNSGGPPQGNTGSILSVQGEVLLPTGDASKGLGNGVTTFGVFAAYDRLLMAQTFMQFQGGFDLPLRTTHAPRSAYLRTAVGKSFSGDRELGRLWTPMIEILADRDLQSAATTHWDVLPEFQVTLNRRQHIRAALGYRIPLNDTAGRPRQIEVYVLWDWFDGGLLEGW